MVISRFYELHKNRHEQLQGNNEGLHSRLQAFLSFGCHKASQIIKVRFHKRVCEGRKHVDLTHGPLHMNVTTVVVVSIGIARLNDGDTQCEVAGNPEPLNLSCAGFVWFAFAAAHLCAGRHVAARGFRQQRAELLVAASRGKGGGSSSIAGSM